MNPRLLALVLSGLLLASGVLAVVAGRLDARSATHVAGSLPEPRAEVEALAVLRSWDERRSLAWAAGDPGALRSLYASGSRSGRQDRALLAAYAERGLRVTGLRTQVLGLHLSECTVGRLTVVVTDRMLGGVAVGSGVRTRLPTDRPSTWTVSLVRVRGVWRVAEAQASPAASTARTSGCRNR